MLSAKLGIISSIAACASANPFRLQANQGERVVPHVSGVKSVRLNRVKKDSNKWRLGSSRVELDNEHDFSYTGPIWLGSNSAQQAMEVVYDTGSDWLTVEGSNCDVCQGNTYSYQNSSSFKFLETTQSTELNYGSASF